MLMPFLLDFQAASNHGAQISIVARRSLALGLDAHFPEGSLEVST